MNKVEKKNYYFLNPTLDWFKDWDVQIKDINDSFQFSRIKNLIEILKLTKKLEGDYLEFGVYQGESAKFICEYIDTNNKNSSFIGFDSFEGLSNPQSEDGKYWKFGDLSIEMQVAKNNLIDFNFVHLIKGWLPDSLKNVPLEKICFVHFDLDLYKPTLDSLNEIYSLLVEGAVVVFDDYGFETCPGVTKAVDEFLRHKEEEIINLSSGGSFFIKL
tara:strand:+ start:1718 stop:2362 length:645 start_codon:yes stop_codon:yes gene_type:complete